MSRRRHKIKKKHLLAVADLFREFIRWSVLTDEAGLPLGGRGRAEVDEEPEKEVEREETGGCPQASSLPRAVLEALLATDEFTSGVNGDINRVRTLVRTALSVIGRDSASGEPPVKGGTDLFTDLKKAEAHDAGYAAAKAGNGEMVSVPTEYLPYADDFNAGQLDWIEDDSLPEDGDSPARG